MRTNTLVVDLGKRRDRAGFFLWSAREEVVNERLLSVFVVRYLDLFQGIAYEKLTDDLVTLASHPEIKGNTDLLVDGANVGEAVIERMIAKGLSPIPILTTGGSTVREVQQTFNSVFKDDGQMNPLRGIAEIHVPKTDLVTAGKLLSQQGRVKVSRELRFAGEFRKQMNNFRGMLNKRTGNAQYEAEDEFIHDDFVWCYLAASWWCTRGRGDELPIGARGEEKLHDFDPIDFW